MNFFLLLNIYVTMFCLQMDNRNIALMGLIELPDYGVKVFKVTFITLEKCYEMQLVVQLRMLPSPCGSLG